MIANNVKLTLASQVPLAYCTALLRITLQCSITMMAVIR